MRWLLLILFITVISSIYAEPEPKKYKSESKVPEKQTNVNLTDEEKKFLREVETKFGVKPEIEDVNQNVDDANSPIPIPQFPAVIAIEIVNDTDSKTKGKRTIDANLGYGYQTNGGYSYNYFGKPVQDKGKFMIYPYSQEDIPPSRSNQYSHSSGSGTSVEIQSSQAFELKEVDDDSSYHYRKPSEQFNTPQHSSGHSSPTTFYTTYNGDKFSGLSTQFPKVMSNYFVDPSKLLQHPQYQTAGLTQEHLRHHGTQLEQRVVPVLVLRVPSSYLKNPTAEIYPNLPQNYPLAQHLNSVNLQELVNNYFKKLGYSTAPQVMSYLNSASVHPSVSTVSASSIAHQQPQTYSSPYIRPTYTQADYSGVQYSAVQPVMAKYPSSYPSQSYYPSHTQHTYEQPQYQYQYVQHPTPTTPEYYTQPRYQYSHQAAEEQPQQYVAEHEASVQQSPTYSVQQQSDDAQTHTSGGLSYVSQHSGAYASEQQSPSQHDSSNAAVSEYVTPKEEISDYQVNAPSAGYSSGHAQSTMQIKTPHYQYQIQIPQDQGSSQQYYSSQQPEQKETVAIVPGQSSQSAHGSYSGLDALQDGYQQQVTEDAANEALPLSENYPSPDHTQATVRPFKPISHTSPTAQSVSYVTPEPYSQSFQSKYRIMVPQTVFRNVSNEKVHYVNSHSLPASAVQIRYHGQENPEEEYTVGTQYIPPIGRQKAPSYPRNYHSHPKRMTRPEHKDSVATSSKKSNERSEKKKSS